MDPSRLVAFLSLALEGFSLALRASLTQRALQQLYARYPLAGCGVTLADGSHGVIAIGRN